MLEIKDFIRRLLVFVTCQEAIDICDMRWGYWWGYWRSWYM